MSAYHAKRSSPRAAFKEGLKLKGPQGLEYSTVEDLSTGGLKIWLDHEMTLGSLVEVEFNLRSKQNGQILGAIQAITRVVRSVKSGDGFQVGLQFVELQHKMRELIDSFSDAEDGPF